jgi:small nuclear ribonucleoprotein (snRNP)-like protein
MAELPPSSADISAHDQARQELESYLNKRMRIGLSDGRVIDGMFLCTDKDCNIVLGNCEEFLSQDEVG